MRTKTNLKNPTCFDRFAHHHQGLVPVSCTITTCQFSCFFAFLLCGGMFSAIYNIHVRFFKLVLVCITNIFNVYSFK